MSTETTATETETVETLARIELVPADEYRRESYGVMLQSPTVHYVTGRGVHNRHFAHRVDVWENRNGVDPSGRPTTERYAYRLNALSTVISDRPERRTYGAELAIGQRVELAVNGFVLGVFEVTARPLSDPDLVKVSD